MRRLGILGLLVTSSTVAVAAHAGGAPVTSERLRSAYPIHGGTAVPGPVALGFDHDGSRRLPRVAGGGDVEVRLPSRLGAPFSVRDRRSGATLDVTLEAHGEDAGFSAEGGYAIYAGPRTTVLHRPTEHGTEDFVELRERPPSESLVYTVALGSGAAGLRRAPGTEIVEIVDEGGAPRLRVQAPFAVDSLGNRLATHLRVEGCTVDESGREPWGRPVTPAGASTCRFVVTWDDGAYPILVDPSWTGTGAMVDPRDDHAVVTLASGRVLVAGGFAIPGSDALATAEVFDPATSTWAATSPMGAARLGHTGSLLPSGKVLVVGGFVAGAISTTTELLDPATGKWTPGPSLAASRTDHTATVLADGSVLVACGRSGDTAVAVATAERLDVQGGKSSPAGALAEARGDHTATVLPSGKVLVAGGQKVGTAAVYDPTTNQWSPTGPLGSTRRDHSATLLPNGKVLVAGGVGGPANEPLATAEVYDEADGKFSPAPTLSVPRFGHGATLLPTGLVLVTGGMIDPAGKRVATTEVFDPAKTAWASGPPMLASRAKHGASLLADGKVLVSGGSLDTTVSAEVWDGCIVGCGAGGGAGAAGSSGASGSAGSAGLGGTGGSTGGSGTGGTSGTGGSAGATAGASSGGSGTAGSAGAPTGGGSEAAADESSGCSCAVPVTHGGAAGWIVAALAVWVARRRR